ncbi:hypothetical protein [Arthrobacter polaris]|uniref:hypothetical protein n=1 Tax=Arthrobacter polaris TaxID=2813727 RepID=UPI001F21627E|nr:hypothetical protein [Arthrobacter polaris]UIK87996.1 hypothetical protein J0916_11050 [Arthrobacter polaris]
MSFDASRVLSLTDRIAVQVSSSVAGDTQTVGECLAAGRAGLNYQAGEQGDSGTDQPFTARG